MNESVDNNSRKGINNVVAAALKPWHGEGTWFIPKVIVAACAIAGIFCSSAGNAVVHAATPLPPPASAATRPYFQSTGGDVVAGASMATDTVPCAGTPSARHIATAGIVGWNSGSSGFSGAGTQYAAQALNYIQDFVSGQSKGGEPNDLTFSNVNNATSVNINNGYFGGMFGSAPCVDYWGAKPAWASITDLGGNTVAGLDGEHKHTGNLVLGAATIANGLHATLYVEGNVAITGNITYASSTWTSREQVPNFRLIVHGSIFIDPDVTQLDGEYVAVPDQDYATSGDVGFGDAATTPGIITTCAKKPAGSYASYDPNEYLTVKIQTVCGKPLTINGSFVGYQFWLLRSGGSLAGNTSSEVFNYSPETWYGAQGSSDIGAPETYQSILGLPPVL